MSKKITNTDSVKSSNSLSHVDSNGDINMVDISEKKETLRVAVATGKIKLNQVAFKTLKDMNNKKGEVLTTAKIASIQAAKKTSELIPLCHQINLLKVETNFVLDDKKYSVYAACRVICSYKTGVEMEALTGVTIALLTIYDMCKAVDKNMKIYDIKLIEKNK